jgi:hypothetical protein
MYVGPIRLVWPVGGSMQPDMRPIDETNGNLKLSLGKLARQTTNRGSLSLRFSAARSRRRRLYEAFTVC